MRPRSLHWQHAMFTAHDDNCRAHHMEIPEGRLIANVRGLDKEHRVPLQVYPFFFAVVRSDRRADCGRLQNDVLARTTVMDAAGNEATPHDVCKRRFPD
jgi:hypothetical protein